MKPCAQSTMKLSLSIEVLNSTAPATINTLVTLGKDNDTVSWNDM